MKKIEAVAYFDRHGEIFQSVENLLPTDTPLYNREALEAVAEEVHKQTLKKFHDHIISGDECDMPEHIELKTIINKITGE